MTAFHQLCCQPLPQGMQHKATVKTTGQTESKPHCCLAVASAFLWHHLQNGHSHGLWSLGGRDAVEGGLPPSRGPDESRLRSCSCVPTGQDGLREMFSGPELHSGR
jgi:hypothetical protein